MLIHSITNNQSNNQQKIEYLRLLFIAEAKEDCILPPYLGSTLRGALGHAFRKKFCTVKRGVCNSCMFIKKCAYAYIFETMRESVAYPEHITHSYIPHPFIIEPPEQGNRRFLPGEIMQFHLMLIGNAMEYYPFFILAFLQALVNGLGKDRSQFGLLKVEQPGSGNTTIWNGGSQIVNSPTTETVSLSMTTRIAEKITINTITPLRIVSRGKLVDALTFEVLARSIFRRLDLLDKVHGSGQGLDIPFGEFIQMAQQIEYLEQESHVNWHDWTRFSNRQNTSMRMGGISGELSYAGQISIFLPWLMAAEVLHIGKGTSFGLGRYKLIIKSEKKGD